MSTLREIIHENVREGELFEKLDRNWCGVSPAGTVARSQTANPGFARFATTGVEPYVEIVEYVVEVVHTQKRK